MRSLYKIIIAVSLLVLLTGMLTGAWMLRASDQDALVSATDNRQKALAQGYVNTIWERYRDVIVALSLDPAQLAASPYTPAFAAETERYFRASTVVRANIYIRGQLLMSIPGSAPTPLPGGDPSVDKAFATAHLQSGGHAYNLLENVTLANGESAVLLQTVSPMRSDKDAPNTAVELVYDITEAWNEFFYTQLAISIGVVVIFLLFLALLFVLAKRTEALVARLHEENVLFAAEAAAAKAENQEKSKFLANISHELRTPLNAIIGFSDILKTEVIEAMNNQKYSNYIADIHASGVHLLSLINDILDYSKAEAGKLEVEVSDVNASKMVHNCMRLVSARAEAGNVSLLETLPKDQIIMVTDGKKFKQIVLNLLSNAVKFTPAGGEVRASAWHNLADDSFTFEIADTGIGIAAKDISIALSPFGQIDSALSRKYEGTGLGLPLTKKFVELLGGTLDMKSKVGVGTTITFTLPREFKAQDGVVVKGDIAAKPAVKEAAGA